MIQLSMQNLKREYERQITHYRNLLVRAQSASASSNHELHMQLQVLQGRYEGLRVEQKGVAAKDEVSRGERKERWT